MTKKLLAGFGIFFLVGLMASTTINGVRIVAGDLTVQGIFTTANGAVMGTPASLNCTNCTNIPGLATVLGSYLNIGSNYYVTSPALALATRTTSAAFTWRNQGTATVTDNADGSITLTAAAAASGNLKIQEQTTGSTFTVIEHITPGLAPVGFPDCGLAIAESGTGKVVVMGFQSNTGLTNIVYDFQIANWTNVTTFSSNAVSFASGSPYGIWMKVVLDSTNLTFYISPDSQNWIQVAQSAKGAFFTTQPDRAGFYADSNNASSPASCTLRSFSLV